MCVCVLTARAFACVCAHALRACVCVCVCAEGSGMCVCVCACVCGWGEWSCACVWWGKRSDYKSTNTPCTLISEMEKGEKKRIETNHIPSKSGTTVVNILVCGLFCCSPHFC